MKLFIFSLFFLSLSIASAAQGGGEEEEYEYPYKKRIKRYESVWNKIIPSHTKIQYAGSMGFLSLGVGWDYGKKDQWETDIFLGFLPEYSTDKVKVTMTLRQNYMPWHINIGSKGFSFEPLSSGIYFTTIFGRKYWATNPDYYPDGYYGFSTRFRINVYLGQRFTYALPSSKRFFARAMTLYYEVSSNDIYIYQAVKNSYLKPSDYLKLSVGIKAQIF